jgi:hypothetical protein
MKKTLLAIAISAATIGTSAYAADKRVYGAVEYGAASIDENAAAVATVYVTALGGSATVTQDTGVGVGRLFLGYRLTPQTAVEVGYFQSQSFGYRVAGVTSGSAAYTSNLSVDYSGFDAAFVWAPMSTNFGDGGFYVKAGAHSSTVESSWTITGAGGTLGLSAEESGTGMLFGAGYDWKFGSDAFVRFSGTRYTSLAGDSDNKATVWAIALGTSF